ncbi:DoxX family protein [Dyadobacter sediminis]|uniref:DoxX family protein n=1 Tax=Dyadobacter sediminis TaxID=1493691 RepID=UPI001983D6DA|nr:DoxX family protein [Dyadobacter sediminis]GGB97268.1 hypothetical protein GCM10011325_25750 [Dyadobacter sediminis]
MVKLKHIGQVSCPGKIQTPKLLGTAALAVPAIPAHVKEWAYAGFFINFLSAFFAHYFVGDPAGNLFALVLMLVLLIVSYVSREKILKSGYNS